MSVELETKPTNNLPSKQRGRKQIIGRYGWQPLSGKGEYREIDKFLLHVDHTYQRDHVNANRVADIARDWSWPACGCLLVVARPDGTLWVYDGQHRLLAARSRDDVQDMPCLVFQLDKTREEARAFVDTNTVRGPMRAYERFKARLAAEEANALRVAAALEDVGYSVGGGNSGQLACIEAIERSFRKDPLAAATALEVCSEIYQGAPIRSDVFKGLFFLESFLQKRIAGSITRPDIRSKLVSTRPEELLAKTRESAQFHGKTGEKIYAAGIVNFINRKKHANRIPSPMEG